MEPDEKNWGLVKLDLLYTGSPFNIEEAMLSNKFGMDKVGFHINI